MLRFFFVDFQKTAIQWQKSPHWWFDKVWDPAYFSEMPGEERQVSVLTKPPSPLTDTISRGFYLVRLGRDGWLTAQSRRHRGPKWITASTHGSARRRRPVKLASSALLVLVPNITTFLSLQARNSQDLVFWKAEESGKAYKKKGAFFYQVWADSRSW